MGAWGTALFSDDLASDVRSEYREHVGDGLSGVEATERLLESYKSSLEDPDDGPVFWLALAMTQWKCGRVDARIRDKAIEIIDSGSNLERWADDRKQLEKRKAVLNQVKEQLLTEPPAPKRIPKLFRDACPWGIGEVIGYRLLSGNWALFRVIDYHIDQGGKAPIFELLDWLGEVIPPREVLETLSVRHSPTECDFQTKMTRFMVLRTSEKQLPVARVNRLGITLEPLQKRPTSPRDAKPVQVYAWRDLDKSLNRAFGLS